MATNDGTYLDTSTPGRANGTPLAYTSEKDLKIYTHTMSTVDRDKFVQKISFESLDHDRNGELIAISGRPALISAGDDMITWSDEAIQLDSESLFGYTPTSYFWTAENSDPNNIIVAFDANDIEDPIITISKPAGDPVTIMLTLTADDGTDTEVDTMTIDVYDDACKAAIGSDPQVTDAGDINKDCITDLKDFAAIAEEWLAYNVLSEAAPKP